MAASETSVGATLNESLQLRPKNTFSLEDVAKALNMLDDEDRQRVSAPAVALTPIQLEPLEITPANPQRREVKLPVKFLESQIVANQKDWRDLSLCTQVTPDEFFPEKGGSVRAAKRICANCVVKEECLAFALENRVEGVWGGLSERERRDLKKRKAA